MKKTFLTIVIIIIGYRAFPQNFSPTSSINNAGAVNNFWGGYTFAYATSGSPWNGAFMSFGGFPSNNYDCQISTDYGPHGGNHISFRTRNGDAATWNNWYEIWHSGNLNNSNTDFTAKNIYASGNVGIGTTTPNAQFEIAGGVTRDFILTSSSGLSGSLRMRAWGTGVNFDPQANNGTFYFGRDNSLSNFIIQSGNVGIGTTNPTAKLYVAGGGRNGLKIDDSLDGTPASKYLSFWQGTGAAGIDPIGTGVIYLGYDQSSDIMFGGSSSNGVWKANGNVLIGQTTQVNPAYKLDVKGKTRADEIVVNTSGADFVFNKNYTLPKLSDVKAYVDKNHHLPEIPSAKEMQTNGMNVGEINTKLLQKVEELTLYTIQQKEENESLKKANNLLEARMTAMEIALSKLSSK